MDFSFEIFMGYFCKGSVAITNNSKQRAQLNETSQRQQQQQQQQKLAPNAEWDLPCQE